MYSWNTLFTLLAVNKPLLDFLLCNKRLQNQGITNWGTNGTPAFHGSHQYPFLKKCTILHCILNLPSPFSLRYVFNSQPILRNVWNYLHWNYETKTSLNDCKILYFDASKTKKVLKFFSDRHRFFLLTENTVVHKYDIHKHIREYGHQLWSNLNVSSVPVFHGSRSE